MELEDLPPSCESVEELFMIVEVNKKSAWIKGLEGGWKGKVDEWMITGEAEKGKGKEIND